ncbi:polysaccharide pyruvyl transferase family protein [Dyadobacter bucti]|uniref:polysaccharide pyruvyl transferase family protein n=1 Tax=Dyadobacter bucti TaxID=2572203 RepID=UPI003F70C63A
MKIQIDGTNTLNKGAELMLYAVLDKIEGAYPKATVIFNSASAFTDGIQTNLNFKGRLLLKFWKYPKALLSRLGVPYNFRIFSVHNPTDADIVLDAGGFQFSDQWKHTGEYLERIESYYKRLKENGTKVVLLSQAFGPFKTDSGKKCAEVLNKYIDVFIAREVVSRDYLIEAGVDQSKIWLYPDFTISASGVFPEQYAFAKNQVCIIPNQKMLTHANMTEQVYVDLNRKMIEEIKKSGKNVFLLNHEGKGDLEICKKISGQFEDGQLKVITGLNAKEIKGVIGQSYIVISSRFHGVSSALNQGVPCLSTSWSHKYELLFKDFEINNSILDLEDPIEISLNKIKAYLDPVSNKKIREHLEVKKVAIKDSVDRMWNDIWSFVQSSN